MSETKDKATPSADDIVDDLAEEMGVDDGTEDEEEIEEQTEAEQTTAEKDEDMAGLGGVFDVTKGKSKKKKKKKKKKKDKKKKANPEGLDDIFNPDQAGDGDEIDLDDIDLGLDDEFKTKNPVNKLFIGIIIALIISMVGIVHFVTVDDDGEGSAVVGLYENLTLLVKGEYRDEMERRVAAEQDEHRQAQLDAMPRYGTLRISGRPRYAQIRLNDEVPFGETTAGQWRELRTGPQTIIEDLPIDDIQTIEVEHPGHAPFSMTIHEDMWDARGSEFYYEISANLPPNDSEANQEFTARGQTDGAGPFRGTVTFNTVPEGATIQVNGYVVRDEDGEPITTPAELYEYWTYDIDFEELQEQEGYEEAFTIRDVDESELNLDEFELEERRFRVDTPPDRGNAVEVFMPADAAENEEDRLIYGTQLQRNMWDCDWKDIDERANIPDSDPIQEHCNYVFEFNVDFPELAAYIERREAERAAIQQERLDAGIEDVADELPEDI